MDPSFLLQLLPTLFGAGTAFGGSRMDRGNPWDDASKSADWLGKTIPGLAGQNYSALAGGPLGRAMRMSALGSGRAFNSGMRGAIGAAGGFNQGMGQVAAGLGKTGYWDSLSRGQGQLGQMAWDGATQMGMGALSAGFGRAGEQDAYRRRIIGAGVGTMGQGLEGLALSKNGGQTFTREQLLAAVQGLQPDQLMQLFRTLSMVNR